MGDQVESGRSEQVVRAFARGTLTALLQEVAGSQDGNRLAAICGDRSITYRALHQRATAVGMRLRERGVIRGDRIGLLCSNRLEWLEICFGAMLAGATVVPFSTWSTSRELAFLVEDSSVRQLFSLAAFADRDFRADLAAAQASGVAVVLIDDEDEAFESYASFVAEGLSSADAGQVDAADPADEALILYTSGSTSIPKGVRLKHRGIVENAFNIGERQGLGCEDRVFLSAPLFWAYGGCNAMPATFTHGATLVLMEKFDADCAIEVIERERCTAIYAMPAMTAAILRAPGFDRARTASLRTGVTIGSSAEFLQVAEQLAVPQICNVYGSTETYGNCAVTWHHWPLERRAVSQGVMLPGQEIRIRDLATNQIIPSTQEGLIEIRGYVTPGYSGASSALNDATFTSDGFYITGDVGRLDEQGGLVFAARGTEMIKRAGINVSPAEIEGVLARFPGISEAAVVGVADDQRGERIVAFVIGDGIGTIAIGPLFEHLRGELSKYKIPDCIEVRDSLPLTATGKLNRKQIKEDAKTVLDTQRLAS